MKCLIVLENHFYLDKNKNVWCDRVVDYNYLQRYLNIFDKILLTGRCEVIDYVIKDKLLVSGKNVEFVPMPNFIGVKGLIKNIFKIKKVVKDSIKKCDCAIFRVPTHLAIFTYKEVIRQKKPLAFEFMMAANKFFEGTSFINSILNIMIDKKVKKMCLQADGVSYVTKSILQKSYPCKALLEPNNPNYFTASYSSIDLELTDYFQQHWAIKKEPKIFKLVHIGYMDSYRKGQDILIKVAKELQNRKYNFELTFVGDGNKKIEFMELTKKLGLEKNINFIGKVKDKKEILEIIRNSHIFVFPTKSEGLPRTLIEAMSQSLPCLASSVDGIPELLEKDFLIDYDDIEGYVKKIIELINNWKLCISVGKKNYQKALDYRKDKLDVKRNEFYKKIYELGVKK